MGFANLIVSHRPLRTLKALQAPLSSRYKLRYIFARAINKMRDIGSRNGISRSAKFQKEIRKKGTSRSAIAEIIATLLLILIAVAAAAIVYAYVIGLIGNASVSTSVPASIISIDDACMSSSLGCSGSNGYFVAVRNVGSSEIAGAAQLYFTDLNSAATAVEPCIISGTVGNGGVYYCAGALPSGFAAGNTATIKVVDPDGGMTVYSLKVSP